MPIIKSAKKRDRQTQKRRALNMQTKKTMRTSIKAFVVAAEKKEVKKLPELLKAAQGAIDTAVKKNVLHANTAARKKSSLAKQAKAAGMKIEAAKKPATTPKPKAATKPAAKPAAKKTPVKKAPAKKPATKK